MTKNILIVGQNFTGKTDLLRYLAKGRIRQYYYPHNHIKLNSGSIKISGEKYQIIDTPGIYTLIPTSENEIAVLNLILELEPEKIIFTINEAALETSLLIMIQLAELGIPLVVYYQPKEPSEYSFNPAKFKHVFETEVVSSTKTTQPSIADIKKALGRCRKPRWVGSYSASIEKILKNFEQSFRANLPGNAAPRFICLMLLLGNQNMYQWIRRHYPKELREQILAFANEKYALANSFSLANRWESLAHNIFPELWHKNQPRELHLSYFFDKYSLKFFWDLIIAALALVSIFSFVIFVGNHILVRFFYAELLNKYIMPALSYLISSLFGQTIFSDLLSGPYGILTTGLPYVFAILLPIMASFFFIYALLDNTGYISRLSLTLNRLLKFVGLNGYSLPTLLFNCCKITSLQKTRTLYSHKEQIISILLILFFLPCITQIVIILNLLTIIPLNYILIFCSVLLLQLLVLLGLRKFFLRQPASVYVAPIKPLHLPNLHQVLQTTWVYLRWYIRDIIPLILSISLLLWGAQACGLLDIIKNFAAPLVNTFLDLPLDFTSSAILGLFRKDFGAASLYDMANNGLLNSIQVLVSTLFITLSLPCLGVTAELYRQYGWRKTILIFGLSLIYAFTIAAIVNKILRI